MLTCYYAENLETHVGKGAFPENTFARYNNQEQALRLLLLFFMKKWSNSKYYAILVYKEVTE